MNATSGDPIFNEPIPVTLVAGYLGAGKTTLVNHWLRHANGLRIAVLVNDFGDINIDADLIEAQSDDVISLAGGCVCCSFGSDLVGALIDLTKRTPRFDHLVIETSGVALPKPITQTLKLVAGLRHDATIVLCDAEQVQARAADKFVGDTVLAQLRDADLLVVNKEDLISAEQLSTVLAWLSKIAPGTRLLKTVRAELDPAAMLTTRSYAWEGVELSGVEPASNAARPLRVTSHAATQFDSLSLYIEHRVDAHVLASELAADELHLYRSKAIVRHSDDRLMVVQTVGHRSEVRPWNKTSTGPSHLVCIAARDQLNAAQIRSALLKARYQDQAT